MFDLDSMSGTWPTDQLTVVFTACDREYHQKFFERWRHGFSQWPVHLHLHAIDVPVEQLPPSGHSITVTHESTVDWDWTAMKRRYDPLPIPQWNKHKATYEWYCQSIRYYMVHALLARCESVIVTDVDAVALRVPTAQQLRLLTNGTQFNIHNSRLYANFCHIHRDDITAATALAWEIKQGCMSGDKAGNDQIAMKKVFTSPRRMESCWTDQEDVTNPERVKDKMTKIVFHAKGTRGKEFKIPIKDGFDNTPPKTYTSE